MNGNKFLDPVTAIIKTEKENKDLKSRLEEALRKIEELQEENKKLREYINKR